MTATIGMACTPVSWTWRTTDGRRSRRRLVQRVAAVTSTRPPKSSASYQLCQRSSMRMPTSTSQRIGQRRGARRRRRGG